MKTHRKRLILSETAGIKKKKINAELNFQMIYIIEIKLLIFFFFF